MENNKKFIITKNPETASILLHSGVKLLNQDGYQWIFMNDGETKVLFSTLDDVIYSNKLFV